MRWAFADVLSSIAAASVGSASDFSSPRAADALSKNSRFQVVIWLGCTSNFFCQFYNGLLFLKGINSNGCFECRYEFSSRSFHRFYLSNLSDGQELW
jgi:hypothetical protein